MRKKNIVPLIHFSFLINKAIKKATDEYQNLADIVLTEQKVSLVEGIVKETLFFLFLTYFSNLLK